MNYFAAISILLVSVVGSSLLLTKYCSRLMLRFGIVDVPDSRRAHSRITPRGGGVSLVLIYSTALALFEYFYSSALLYTSQILQIFLPIALLSLWDDIYQLGVIIRLFIHCLCALLAIILLVQPFGLLHTEWPYLELTISTLALVIFLNLYNFLDGMDGISVSESIHLSCTTLILCALEINIIPCVGFIIITTTILLGWAIGFLFFNWHPARVFLGDVGSISLGFLHGICLILVATASYKLLLACLIAALYYVADGGLTIMMRLINGEKIWEPHLKHFFQRAIRSGQSQPQVISKIVRCNIMLMCLAISALYYPVLAAVLAAVTTALTLISFAR